jgi:hypothetical protein
MEEEKRAKECPEECNKARAQRPLDGQRRWGGRGESERAGDLPGTWERLSSSDWKGRRLWGGKWRREKWKWRSPSGWRDVPILTGGGSTSAGNEGGREAGGREDLQTPLAQTIVDISLLLVDEDLQGRGERAIKLVDQVKSIDDDPHLVGGLDGEIFAHSLRRSVLVGVKF